MCSFGFVRRSVTSDATISATPRPVAMTNMIMRIRTDHQIFGYPALALIMFVIATGLGVALIVASLVTDRRTKPNEHKDPL